MIDSMLAIQKLLQHEYCETIKDNRLELKEKQAKTRFSIIESPDNGLKLSIPAKGKAHSAIVGNAPNYKKSCDFLVIAPQDENGMDIYFLEIKKTLSPDKNGIPVEACEQIIFTTPVWKYLNSMMRTHFDVRPEITEHFVVLAEKEQNKLDKQPIRPQPVGECQYKDKNFKIIHSLDEISFKDLKCQAPNPS